MEPKTSRGSARPKIEAVCTEKYKKALKEALRMNCGKYLTVMVAGLLALGPISYAKNLSEAKAEQDRLQNAGKVMQEILAVPDDIPQDLIDKARCVIHSKVKLGADASAAAGPKGRSAAADTDVFMRAEVLSYSRARGAFPGISLDGSTLRPDKDVNRELYGESTAAAKIITESDSAAPSAALQNSSPKLKR
jgi:hypothetical protein